ncbi:dermonecrotic toxin domain-containing protein, partial [Pseudomonas sp.]|uniref:dermonecrotic toxin domain-containing protein n=2 Tax=Pseudomonas TaxID=286 RepID=UPI0035A0E824
MRTTGINATGVHYVRDHLNHVPLPDRQASQAVKQWFAEQGHDLDPDRVDVVTLHYRSDRKGGSLAEVRQCISLSQAVLSNWQGESNNDLFGALFRAPWAGTLPEGPVRIVNALPARGFNHYGAEFSVFNGLFRRTEPPRYDATTHVPVAAESFQQFIENLDFQAPFKNTLHTYWREHMSAHRLACKLNFIAACNKQVSEGSLSEAARKLLWQAAELMPRVDKLRMSTLSIYGYAATDLLYLCNPSTDLTVLYIPGNSSPLLEFASENALKDWVGEQCKDPLKREAL